MLSFECKGKINVVKAKGDYIGVGCADGWVYLFKGEELLWEYKIGTTYYRDPYNDVSVLSLDIGEDFLTVGTDFMDGKIYAISFDGDVLWYKQFLTIVGCWERPDDVVATAIKEDKIAVGTEWINSYIHVLSFRGENIDSFKVDGYITDISFWKDFLIGTTEALYHGKKKEKDLNVKEIIPLRNLAVVFSDDGIYTFDGSLRKIYGAKNPLVAANQQFIACYDKKLVALSHNGDVLWCCEIEKPKRILCKNKVYLGYDNTIKIVDNGEIIGELRIDGLLIELAENYIISGSNKRLHIFEIP